MKRFLFSCAVIFALVLSSCGGGSSVTKQQDAESGTTDTAAQRAENTADSETVLVNLVTFMYGEGFTATYTYDNSGNTASAIYAHTLSTTWSLTETYYYTYDESGNLTAEDYIYENKSDYINGTYGMETKSEYDAAGKLVSEEIINFSSDGEETTPYGIFAYSYNGNVGTATATVQSDGETYTETRTATYNRKGLLLSKEVYYENEDNCYYPSKMTYDETGRLISSIVVQPGGNTVTWTYDYTNDDKGNLLTYSQKMEEGVNGENYEYYYSYYEYSYNEDNELETISTYSSQEEGGTLTLNGIGTYIYHYLDNSLLESVDGYDEDGEREEDLFYFEYEAAVQLPADEAEAVQEAQTDRIRAFLRGELL